jgi:hypothetical protein
MLDNRNLNKALKVKNDEFYTKLTDIDNELKHYKDIFAGKTIYCNCDNPTKSNFVKWFYRRFNMLHLKRLIVTAYNKDGFGLYWDTDFSKVDINTIYINDCIENDVRYLSGNGDFRSDECIELLKQADIVVTNPPFSLFHEYVKVLMDNNKDFIIVGSLNAVSYKDVFKYIKNNTIQIGFTSGGLSFDTPELDNKCLHILWYTTLPIAKHNEELILYKHYTPEEFPKYDNYDAINVDKVADIPEDYDGAMGVPISFILKYNPNQFDIIDLLRPVVNGVVKYQRIIIKNNRLKNDNIR